jgi:hypothetical protein
VLDSVRSHAQGPTESGREIEIPLRDARPGMRLREEIRSGTGALLVPIGFEISERLLERLRQVSPARSTSGAALGACHWLTACRMRTMVPMCYSAQLQAAYLKYLRETGAQMDIDQFVEIFGARITDSSIRIPRAIERWFDEPKRRRRAQDQGLHRPVALRRDQQARARSVRAEETPRRRGARAGAKPTKAAAESQRIATNKIEQALTRLDRLKAVTPDPAEGANLPPALRAPRHPGRRPARDAPGAVSLPPARRTSGGRSQAARALQRRRDSLGKYWKGLFGLSHAVMLVDSFFENVDRNGQNQVLHFVPKPAGTMLIACLYAEWRDPKGGSPLLSFAAITDEPPPEVAAAVTTA